MLGSVFMAYKLVAELSMLCTSNAGTSTGLNDMLDFTSAELA